MKRSLLRLLLLVLLLPAACSQPMLRPVVERQDPARFESCSDVAVQQAYSKALALLQARSDADALPLLRSVIEQCPEHVPALVLYQDAALRLGGEAAGLMREHFAALPDSVTSPVPAFAKARLLESNFQRKLAIDELLRRHDDFAWGWLAQARLNRWRGQLGEAAECFGRAIERHPQLHAAHLELAEVLVELGRPQEAVLPYENYLRSAPDDRDTAHAFVSLLLYVVNKPAAARPWIERLLADDPLDEAARMDLAAADWRSGNLDAALAGYIELLRQRPDNARAALNIGFLHYDAFVRTDEDRREHWPKARKALLWFLRVVRPEEGHDYVERHLAVPFRLEEIQRVLGDDDGRLPAVDELK